MPANTKHFIPPKSPLPRPPLPLEHANPHIKSIDTTKPPPVKFQEILRDGQATIVGRIKIPTPNGHAFILRRLDTGAVSLTTMFRAAFPTAGEDAEKAEMNWVKLNYDIAGANKSGKARFAGTWVNTDVALSLAEGYSLAEIIPSLAVAEPDPNVVYRKSNKAQQQSTTLYSESVISSPSPNDGPAPTKRRREASPAVNTPPPPTAAGTTTPPPSARRAASPTPRRSQRLKSPVPVPSPAPLTTRTAPRTPRPSKSTKAAPASGTSDDTAVDEEDAEVVVKAAQPNAEEDIREQKEMIAKLKAEREAKREAKKKEEAEKKEKERKAAEKEEEEEAEQEQEGRAGEEGQEEGNAAQKRAREEDVPEYSFDFAPPEQGDRVIATNRRIGMLADMPPERKSFAWGALAFAAGLGAVSLFPTLSANLAGFF